MHESEEALKAEDREYGNAGEEQAQRMQDCLGPALDRKLEIMAAKLEVIEMIRNVCNTEIEAEKKKAVFDWHGALYASALNFLTEQIDILEKEIKAELK